ncbi:MAG: hypothetical protein ACYC4U_23285 [Pirellulaceae bacterium]
MFTARSRVFLPPTVALALTWGISFALGAEPLIPGTGVKIVRVGDDFEDSEWEYDFRGLKSSQEMDEQPRLPVGESKNQRWYEGIKRGHPDVIRRVPTPPGGLKGSQGALLLQSQRTGIPGRVTNRMQQDDFIADVNYRLGGVLPASQSPSVVVRVFLPPVDQWENRSGPHFAFRCATDTYQDGESETYWPGMFVVFERRRERPARDQNFAYIRIRANRRGEDYRSLQITTTGWWTLGLSLTPDGRMHYYARPGIENLTAENHLASENPYGKRYHGLKTFFFNVCNLDDGRTWSTPWVIDDPTVYYIPTTTASASAPLRR